MNLIAQAEAFIQNGNPPDLSQLLLKCIHANNLEALAAVQRLYEDMYGGITFNFELKAPAAVTLLYWGDRGLDALVEGAKRTLSSKNLSLTIQILCTVSAREFPQLFIGFPGDDKLSTIVQKSVQENLGMAKAARERLTEFLLSLPNDEDAISAAGSALQMLSFFSLAPAKELIAAVASRWLAVSLPVLTRYEDLIEKYPDEEPQFQAFFGQVPQVLDPLAMHVWSKPDLNGAKEPDFIVRRTDGSYLIVEIETPGKQLVTASQQISAHVTQAVSQAMQYRSFLLERIQQANTLFPEFRDPNCLVVIGLERNLNADQRRALMLENEHRRSVQIVGFDWLADRAEATRRNIISAGIAVRRTRMI
jgi:hypothetical protein